MFLSGRPLRSVYRVIARDGRVVSFHCDARMVRRADGRPWFIHGVGFDITDLKHAEEALQNERNFASAVVDTVAALVLVLDPEGRIVRFNRACEQTTGYDSSEVAGRQVWELVRGAGRRRTVPRSVRRGVRRPASGDVREHVDQPAGRAAVDCVVQHRAARPARRFGIRDSHRNRRDRIEAPGAHHSGNQRQGTAANRAGPARWTGPALDRSGFLEQGAGAETAGKRSAGSGRGGQDCGIGEPGDQQDTGAVARSSAGAFRRARSDECAGAAGAGGGGSVPGVRAGSNATVRF